MKTYTRTITWNNADIDVSFNYYPGDPGVRTYSNGDPGYPPSPPEFEIISVDFKGTNVTDLFDDDDFVRMEELIESSRDDE